MWQEHYFSIPWSCGVGKHVEREPEDLSPNSATQTERSCLRVFFDSQFISLFTTSLCALKGFLWPLPSIPLSLQPAFCLGRPTCLDFWLLVRLNQWEQGREDRETEQLYMGFFVVVLSFHYQSKVSDPVQPSDILSCVCLWVPVTISSCPYFRLRGGKSTPESLALPGVLYNLLWLFCIQPIHLQIVCLVICP